MFYKILVNGRDLGPIGHRQIENVHLSVSGDAEEMNVFVNAVCNEGDGLYYYSWIKDKISPDDRVEIVPIALAETRKPLKRLLIGQRFKKGLNENIICDFCYRDETETGEMIHLDEHRPTICSKCVQVCAKIYEQWEQKG